MKAYEVETLVFFNNYISIKHAKVEYELNTLFSFSLPHFCLHAYFQ